MKMEGHAGFYTSERLLVSNKNDSMAAVNLPLFTKCGVGHKRRVISSGVTFI